MPVLSPSHLSRHDHFVASFIHKHSTFLFEPVVFDTIILVYRITTIRPHSSPFLHLTLFHQRCSCVLRVLISQRSCTFIFLYVKSTATMLHRLTCKFLAGQCPVPRRLFCLSVRNSYCAKTHLQLHLIKFIRLASNRIKRRLDRCHLPPSPPPDHRHFLESFQIKCCTRTAAEWHLPSPSAPSIAFE